MVVLADLPRLPLLASPSTPLHPAPRLSADVGVEIWLKRDDLTGLGLGGNKVRGLEFLLGDAKRQGCDCVVTGAGPQSNWAALAALAARAHGFHPVVVHYGEPTAVAGNLRLSALVDAEVHFTGLPERDSVDRALEQHDARLRAVGRRPYLIPRGGATPHGALGYVRAVDELAEQLTASGVDGARIWLATGSCGTQAGLVAGVHGRALDVPITGVTVSRPASECRARITEIARGATELAGVGGAPANRGIDVVDGFVGPGYGKASPEGVAAARLVAATEGVLLDPVFGAKAMAALLDRARTGEVAGPVVFLVTGGAPTLFVDNLFSEAGS